MARYFNTSEFLCRCCGGGANIISPDLIHRLDILRETYGHPIYVSCGYLCPRHNAEVGGVYNSQHVRGTAADIYVDGNYEQFYNFVYNSRLFDGLGYYPTQEFVHVDIRDGGANPNHYIW